MPTNVVSEYWITIGTCPTHASHLASPVNKLRVLVVMLTMNKILYRAYRYCFRMLDDSRDISHTCQQPSPVSKLEGMNENSSIVLAKKGL